MTRNNLDAHLSWLLSNEVRPPVGVQTIPPAPVVVDLEDIGLREEDFEEDYLSSVQSPVRSPVQKRPIARSVRDDLARPSIPSSAILNATTGREIPRISSRGAMGEHELGQKSTGPGLMGQHQLGTPASTTVSTTTSSSLTLGYANFLRKDYAGTPTSKPNADRQKSRSAGSLQAPQTPRETPRSTSRPNLGNIESVDLTGDNSREDVVSRSSSTEFVFGVPKVVWTPAAAARPEPLPKSSKKRKSDDMARSSAKKRLVVSPGNPEQLGDICLEGFMDIDEMVPSRSQPDGSALRKKAVRPTVEAVGSEGDVEGYQVTQTLCWAETHTRQSVCRVPSSSDGLPRKPKLPALEQLPATRRDATPTSSPSHIRAKIQVARSPIRKQSNNEGAGDSPSSQVASKHQRRHHQRVIQDSDDEDDDMILDQPQMTAFSSPSLVKNSPQVESEPNKLRWHQTLDLEPKPETFKYSQEKILRVGSPLRPISSNAFERPPGSPTVSTSTIQPSNLLREEATPPSTLTADDKVLVNRYLSNTSALDSYLQRVKHLKLQSAADCMEYTDSNQTVPQAMRSERVRILDMEKAYDALEKLASSHQKLKLEKRNLARKISELLDLDLDTSTLEERQVAVTLEMREHEKEVGKLLHASGAINDGFGSGSVPEAQHDLPKTYLKSKEVTQLTSGSSAAGGAQVILQTQFPSLQRATPNSYQASQDKPTRQPPRWDASVDGRTSHFRTSPSPICSPERTKTLAPTTPRADVNKGRETSTRRVQQSFFREASPANYGIDDDADFDAFMLYEAENEDTSRAVDEVPLENEDEYGDGDEDDFLEIAQELENRSCLGNSSLPSIPNTSSRTPGNREAQKSVPKETNDMYSHVDTSFAGMLDHPWSKDVKKALRERFHLRGFRQNQLDAINATLSGKDVFVLMPTGGGKSLCYQLPAIVQSGKTRGVTVVISPLLSLMSDQVDHLKKRNIQAVLLNGEKAREERDLVYNALRGPFPDQFIQVLYITPEMIGKSNALLSVLGHLHKKGRLARIVIDEAHCVSQWGHDFRPDYKTLSNVRKSFPGVPFMALTATATQNVKADCIHNLDMEGCEEYKQSFNRPNLHYEVRAKTGKGASAATLESMVELISGKYRGQSGIIYTLSRSNCEDLATKLQEQGIKAHHFHANMQPEEKTQVQRDWQAGKWQVVVATIAFGMGIDKADVRFVIHHTIPKSLEGYYQETGRAGRDGKPSGCYLYYGYQDTAVLRRFIEDSEGGKEVKDQQRQMLNRMVQFCENQNDCRRVEVLAYFGESFSKDDCNNSCDNCNSDAVFETVDMSNLAKTALRVIRALQNDNVTLLYVVDVLRGSKASRIKENHQKISGHGSLKTFHRGEVERLLTRLLTENALEENNISNRSGFVIPYLRLGPSARDFLSNRRKLKVLMNVTRSPAAGVRASPVRKPVDPTSTLFTSPITPSSRTKKGKGRAKPVHQDQSGEAEMSDLESEDDAFGPVRGATRRGDGRRNERPVELGPPITMDDRMNEISGFHRDVVDNFVEEAKKTEERLRNRNNHSRRYFKESEFREMAINWTLSLDDMNEISGIDSDKVARYGEKFIPLIKKYHQSYEEMMGGRLDRDMDRNHQNVIDLCDDEDGETEDEEEEDYPEEQSKFFVASDVQRFNQEIAVAQNLPQRRYEMPESTKKPSRGGFRTRGRGRGVGKRRYSGKSAGSAASGSSRQKTASSASASKKAPTMRKTSAPFSKKTSAASGNTFDAFRRTTSGVSSGIMGMPMT